MARPPGLPRGGREPAISDYPADSGLTRVARGPSWLSSMSLCTIDLDLTPTQGDSGYMSRTCFLLFLHGSFPCMLSMQMLMKCWEDRCS